MELKLEAVEETRLPPGCVVGVRIGDILKQGKYEPSRSYNFPLLERRRNAKIDVYKHAAPFKFRQPLVCSHVTACQARSFSSEVVVTSTDPAYAGIKLKVNTQSSANIEGDKRERENRSKTLKNQAKDYLNQHNIEERLALAVKSLLKEQPEDPTEFLCRQLRQQVGAPEAPAPAPAAAEESAAEAAPVQEPILEAAPPKDGLRLQAREALFSASQDGSLQALLADIKQEHREADPWPPVIPTSPNDSLRQEACEVLMKASLDGRLGKVLSEIMSEKPEGDSAPAAAPAAAAAPPTARPAPVAAGAKSAPLPPAPTSPLGNKPPAMLMNSMSVHGPAFASMGVRPMMMMI